MIDFDKRLFSIDPAGGTPSVGSLLISEPFLKEEYFHHSVITLVDYAPGQPAMGVVMNRRTTFLLQSLLAEVTRSEPVPVYCGGPMSADRLFYLHTLGELIPQSRQITHGLYIGGDFNEVVRYINSNFELDGFIRFFVGYSGWNRLQLEEELDNKVWAVAETTDFPALLTGEEDAYWHRYVRRLGPRFRGWLYHPSNPHAN